MWLLTPQVLAGPQYTDKAVFPPSVLADVVSTFGENLPHPLIFELHQDDPNDDNSKTYVGVLEFSAPESTILLPKSVMERFSLPSVTAELVTNIPKGTELSLKPLQFYPQVHNWKFFLESRLPKLYTTLTRHQKLLVEDENGIYELFVEKLNAKTVCITDTEMALDIVPLDNIMAQQQLEFAKSMSYLEEATLINSEESVTVQIQPYNSAQFKTQMFTFKPQPKMYIVVESTSAQYNFDVVIGADKFVGMECFRWSSMELDDDGDTKVVAIDSDSVSLDSLYLVPFAWEVPCDVTITLVKGINEVKIPQDSQKCSNCDRYVAISKMTLHEAHCLRHNKKCECGAVFAERIPEAHWHCNQCFAHGNSLVSKMKHEKMNHQAPYTCDGCGKGPFDTFTQLVTTHKATECPKKLHECQFCHLIVPQEQATYEDRYSGFTHHESTCGNKTIECFKCNKVLRSKDMAKHLHMHELDKIEMNQATKISFTRCTNVNCVNTKNDDNILGMCTTCYGQLYVQQHDPDHSRLQARIERRYMLQLTKGCGFDWCLNVECCSGNSSKLSVKDAIQRVRQELLPAIAGLPITKGKTVKTHVWFCVNESVQKRRDLVDGILAEKEYEEALVYKAANEERNEGIREWLHTHAVRLST